MSPVLDQRATDGDIVFAVARKAEPAGVIVVSIWVDRTTSWNAIVTSIHHIAINMQTDVARRSISRKTQAGALIDGAVAQLCFASGAGLEYGRNAAIDDIDQPTNGSRSVQ